MSTHPPTTRPAPYARFRHGEFECTVVSDGILEMGPARDNFPNADPADVDALLEQYHLSPDDVRLNDNVLVVDTGDALVQFDSGVGIDPEFGRGFFGPKTGQTIPNLRDAGIRVEDIDVLAITHTHPDHVWGLVDVEGRPLYPNADIVVAREDFEWWTDLRNMRDDMTPHQRDHYTGARKNLMPYYEQGRIRWADDGAEIATGITAIATPGHSPGHRVYKIESGGEVIVCWGDLCHHQVLLLQHPEWSFQFDHDKPAATAQRHRIYDFVESNRFQILAYHFPFPGLGHLRRTAGGYEYLPSEIPLELPDETKALLAAAAPHLEGAR